MMGIVLFEEITTEQHLVEIEAEAAKYQGLYVDMENADERKYVKDKATQINGLLKKLDRARIDMSKDFKIKVEAEARAIKDRLESANAPFTLLIDAHKEARAKVLAEKKAKEDAAALLVQIELDHNEAISLDKLFEFEKAEAIKAQAERDEQIRREATEQAEREAARKAQQLEQDRINAEEAEKAAIKARESNKEHKANVNNTAKNKLLETGINEEQAKAIIVLIATGKVPNVRISY